MKNIYEKVGVTIAQGPPVPIPNTEVKLCGAEDTCLATGRENRSTLTQTVGYINAEGPPVPIPNTEVKLCSGENTLRETVWEDSSVLTLTEESRAICFPLSQKKPSVRREATLTT